MLRHAEHAYNKHAWQSDKVAVLLKAILGSSQKCYFGLLVILLQTRGHRQGREAGMVGSKNHLTPHYRGGSLRGGDCGVLVVDGSW